MTFVLIGISAHPVWIGLILSYVVGYRLHLTPIAGYCNFFPGTVGAQCSGPVNWAYHLILPWITFMILFAALYVRLVRANVMETMSEDYVRTARAKGASQSRVMVQHVLRNSMLPVVTILGMDLGLALGGAIFTESIFNLPGLGHEVINALQLQRSADDHRHRRLLDDLRDRLQLHRRRELRLPRPESPTPLMAVALEVKDLTTRFRTDDGVVKAVSGVSFSVDEGKTLGVVGESGSGKSVTFLTVMGLVDPKQSEVSGSVLLHGEEMLGASQNRMREIRGVKIGMIFQDPMTSLNPVKTIGWQLEEAVLIHQDVSKKEARKRAIEVLKQVEIPHAERRVDGYPHQFSGGMRQRVMIAMALINNPEILIADEPTTALDVTTQAQILRLMERLQQEFRMAIVMITHDLGVVAELADDVIVMYGGRVVEESKVNDLFAKPEMPYTWGLLGSLPRLNSSGGRLEQIPGQPPSLLHPPSGCPFNPRCEYVMSVCSETLPDLRRSPVGDEHRFRCHLDDETRARIWAAKHASMVAEDAA